MVHMKGERSMQKMGIMDQIKELLIEGKTTRQLINRGYKPGSVYSALRQLNAELIEEINPEVYHANPAIRCPGCQKPIVHWGKCPFCDRLFPADSECDCAKDSTKIAHGYTWEELL